MRVQDPMVEQAQAQMQAWNGHSMVDALRRVMVCSPAAAAWDRESTAKCWRELGFQHAPNFPEAKAQHAAMCGELERAGAEVVSLTSAPDLSLDAVYAHDASLPTDFGVVLLRMGKANRIAESGRHRELYERIGIPILGEVVFPGKAEAGDMVWLDSRTLLIGQGYRTNSDGIDQIRNMLEPKGVEVLSAPLPYGPGPSACLHLMSLISLLDQSTAVVDLSWLAVQTVELLQERKFRFIEIHSGERETLACNVLALGNRRLLALEENRRTNERLTENGFDVRTFPGSELCINGSGGPTCLTRPLLRG